MDSVGEGRITGGYNSGDGGIYNTGTLTLGRGIVFGNQTWDFLHKTGSGGGIYNAGTLNVAGGSIVKNISRAFYGGGAGIYNAETGILDLQGGAIMQNGTMTVSGAPAFYSNTGPNSESGANIYLRENRTISVGALTEGAAMSVYSAKGNGIFTAGYSLNNSEAPGK